MNSEGQAPRRLLLDLCHMPPEPEGISAAAEFARLMQGELVGIYVEDEAVHRLACLPFARELRAPGEGWSPIELGRIEAEFRDVACRMQALLQRHGARLGVPSHFESVRGDPAGFVAARCGEADILVLATPRAARGPGSFAAAWRAALRSHAAILALPRRVAQRQGPVVALLGADGARQAAIAAALAAAAGTDLLVLLREPGAEASAALARAAQSAGLDRGRLRIERLDAATPEALLRVLGRARMRLLLADRRSLPEESLEAAARLAEERGVPLLLA